MAAAARARIVGHVGPLPAVAYVPVAVELVPADEVAFDDLVVGGGVAYARVIPDFDHVEIRIGGRPCPLPSSPQS